MRRPWCFFLAVIAFTISGCGPATPVDICEVSDGLCGQGGNPPLGTECGPDNCGTCQNAPFGQQCSCRDSKQKRVYN